MCGIFGMLVSEDSNITPSLLHSTVNNLFELSESRGKEAAGLAILSGQTINVYKQPLSASVMIRTKSYKKLFDDLGNNGKMTKNDKIRAPFAVIGHSRLVTDGLQGINYNNQPIVTNGVIGVHNGIIVNKDALWRQFPSMERKYEIDTEVIMSLIRKFYTEKRSLIWAVQSTFCLIKGSASIAVLLNDNNNLVLATNTGSLYLCTKPASNICIFASERYILEALIKMRYLQSILGTRRHKQDLQRFISQCEISQIKPGNGCLINLLDLSRQNFSFDDKDVSVSTKDNDNISIFNIVDPSSKYEDSIASLKRCAKCILPETMPMIEFDDQGICNFCRSHEKMEIKGPAALEEFIDQYRSRNGEQDCIFPLSGGRDSCYGLHYVKNVLKMNPIAYTYDWGMVTDLARRNQARLCGKLGIEHIIISADIKTKRKNIQRNVRAWLKKPDLGMIPLFMAGDKQYFYYANKLRKQMGIKLVFLCGNRLEKTGFKSLFSGISEEEGRRTYDISLFKKIKLANYYAKQFLLNPSYLNRSILDTLFAYYSAYILSHDFAWLFQYINWDEKEIMSTLINEYDWEVASDSNVTWRIGDGTAAFYNYIYYTVAGFTENDTFRSNQIREGMITREEALELVKVENKPRYDSIQEYSHQIGFDCEEALYIINSIPKLY